MRESTFSELGTVAVVHESDCVKVFDPLHPHAHPHRLRRTRCLERQKSARQEQKNGS
jgi:hypothetical protein